MRILILGHSGLLGNMVYKYFKFNNYELVTTNLRWDNKDFKEFVSNQKVDYIINCIGIIPQRKPNDKLYHKVNYELPVWLDNLGIRVIHPDTDESDDSAYSLSKKMARELITKNTKILKSSIIGYEKDKKVSFLEWFLNSEGSVSGFTNQYWNGNTTLEWSKYAEIVINEWDNFKHVTVLSNPECLSKYEILNKIKEIYNKNINIIPSESNIYKNNCMLGDYITKNIFEQIKEMKNFLKLIKII